MLLGLLVLFSIALVALVLLGGFGVVWYLTHPPRRTEGQAIANGMPCDPKEAGYDFDTADVDADGGKLNLWLVPGGAPDGPAVVLLHAWGDSRIGALAWLGAWAPVASRVVLFDLRGHGNSPFPRCTWGRREVGDIRAAIAALRERGCDGPVVLAGGSLGGAIAVVAAAEGVGCDGVVVDSPYRDSTDVTRNVVRRMGLPAWPIVDLGWWWLTTFGAREHRNRATDYVGRLNVPLLVLHGEADTVVPVADARALVDAAADGTLVTFAGSDHLMGATEHESAYRRALADWVAAKGLTK